ncbi:DUF234 domain-containing protein [Campylobacter majalis]|uniref:DUF234 domain-containing protein n=1 Tax=Campylobacter majalis TaxID=2790656 RepID=UPI003D68878A
MLKFHFVFDEYETYGSYYDVFEAIECEILAKIDNVLTLYSGLSDDEIRVLIKLARSDRKWLNPYKILPQHTASNVYAKLLTRGILKIEKSRERPRIKLYKNEKFKKAQRRYKIEDKVYFASNFSRFYFRFIAPNAEILSSGNIKSVKNIIINEFLEYASYGFEMVCAWYLRQEFNLSSEALSYWDKEVEIDMLFSVNGKMVAAEAKYKNKKVCKNVLNILLNKCQRLNIVPDFVYLFSKSGFSNELESMKNARLKLIDLEKISSILKE